MQYVTDNPGLVYLTYCERWRRQPPTRAPYLRARRARGRLWLSSVHKKIWTEISQSSERNRLSLAPSNRTGFEARRRRLARSAHAIEAERGARRPRWRPPEAARDLRLHGDLRRRLVAGEVCRIASTPTTASSPLSFLRRRLVGFSTRSSHYQDPAGSTAPWIVRNRSKVLLTLTRRAHKACSHRALIHSVRTTQRLAWPPRPRLLFS